MTTERLQASELRADLREALNRVEYNGVHIEIHRREKIAGVLVPLGDYQRLQQQLSESVHEETSAVETDEPMPTPAPRDNDDWMEWNK